MKTSQSAVQRAAALYPHQVPPRPLYPTPYTLHPTPHTLHPTTYTPHPTPYTLSSTGKSSLTRAILLMSEVPL